MYPIMPSLETWRRRCAESQAESARRRTEAPRPLLALRLMEWVGVLAVVVVVVAFLWTARAVAAEYDLAPAHVAPGVHLVGHHHHRGRGR